LVVGTKGADRGKRSFRAHPSNQGKALTAPSHHTRTKRHNPRQTTRQSNLHTKSHLRLPTHCNKYLMPQQRRSTAPRIIPISLISAPPLMYSSALLMEYYFGSHYHYFLTIRPDSPCSILKRFGRDDNQQTLVQSSISPLLILELLRSLLIPSYTTTPGFRKNSISRT
jgi:hypothetical protein